MQGHIRGLLSTHPSINSNGPSKMIQLWLELIDAFVNQRCNAWDSCPNNRFQVLKQKLLNEMEISNKGKFSCKLYDSFKSKPLREALQDTLSPFYWTNAHNQDLLQSIHAPYVLLWSCLHSCLCPLGNGSQFRPRDVATGKIVLPEPEDRKSYFGSPKIPSFSHLGFTDISFPLSHLWKNVINKPLKCISMTVTPSIILSLVIYLARKLLSNEFFKFIFKSRW